MKTQTTEQKRANNRAACRKNYENSTRIKALESMRNRVRGEIAAQRRMAESSANFGNKIDERMHLYTANILIRTIFQAGK